MSGGRDTRVEEMLSRIREIPEEQRASWLESACDDPALRREVESLLPFLDTTPGGLASAADLLAVGMPLLSQAETERGMPRIGQEGERIGPYRLLQLIGEGGMGRVYLAEQLEPVRRRVALKLIKTGMDSEQVLARFEAERQALALMDHPGIAGIHEAGATATGHPYFVMEYIQGEPISTYCDRHRLTLTERISLLRKTCDAVQHAHQKGIIHRDLKPPNILVRLVDGEPVPTIIDFGVAKATSQRLTERTLFTQMGTIVGTPEYMSPEQAELTGLDVDTRTDVYALGVILYELLVGVLPFDPRELRQAGFDEIRRRIREDEPPRPSTKVSTLSGKVSEETARRRQATLPALRKSLKGELDWITMRALEKDRTRRYGSPAELSADLGRSLDQEPVLAGPPGRIYRMRKFARRHRVGVGATGLILLALIAGVSAALYGLVRARQAESVARTEAVTARRVSDFMEGLFTAPTPGEARGMVVTAREILDRGAKELDRQLTDEPEVGLRMTKVMGNAYYALGDYQTSRRLLEESLAMARELHGEDDDLTLDRMFHLSKVLHAQGEVDESERLLRSVLDVFRTRYGEEHRYTQDAMGLLGRNYANRFEFDKAEPLLTRTLELQRATLGDGDPETLATIDSLALVWAHQRRFEEAESLFEEALRGFKKVSGPDSPAVLDPMIGLAWIYKNQGDLDKSARLFEEILEVKRRVYGNEHPKVANTLDDLALVYQAQHRLDRAIPLMKESLALRRKILGNEHRHTLLSERILGFAYFLQGSYAEGDALYHEAIEGWLRIEGENGDNTQANRMVLAWSLWKQHRMTEADAEYRKVVDARMSDADSVPPEDTDLSMAAYAALRGFRADALEHLRRRVRQRGIKGVSHDNPDLASLRGIPEFEELFVESPQEASR